MFCRENLLHVADVLERFAGDELASGINRLAAFGVAPHAEGVEVFQREPERVHAVVARAAQRLLAMNGERLAQGWGAAGDFLFGIFEQRNVGGRRWRRRAEDVFQYEQAAFHRRGARGVRRDDEHGAVGEDAAARRVLRQADAAHLRAFDVEIRQVVMLRETFVEEGVIGIEEFQHAAVLSHDMGEGHLGFTTHGATQFAVEFHVLAIGESLATGLDDLFAFLFLLGRERSLRAEFVQALACPAELAFFTAVASKHDEGVDVDAVDVADLEPLPDEVLDERLGAGIGEHALYLGVEVLAQFAFLGETEELGIRHGGPEEIAEARGERVFIDERMLLR